MTDTLQTREAAETPRAAYRTKLIEVALPLEAINVASAHEKSVPRRGHPATLHLWWARRPLAACRAVLFAQMVDDPSAVPEELPTEEEQEAERDRLFEIIEKLVLWENSTNETVLMAARREIARSVARAAGVPAPRTEEDIWRILREHAPPVLDPFCGGGSIPLEAQRLGLEAHASDLNPVAVLITKALIEIPPKFAGKPPVNPAERRRLGASGTTWKGTAGLAADVRYYGEWMREEAQKRIGHLYPKARLPGGGEATVIAWLWARTVICPNPACGARMPLVRSFALSTKKGKETWVEPVVDHATKSVRFEVNSGRGTPPEGTVNRRGARCIVCDTHVPFTHVRSEGRAGRMGQQLMAIVAEGNRGRTYMAATKEQVEVARSAVPEWAPEADLPHNPRDFKTPNYGMRTFADLFTPRQLVALTTFSDLVGQARERALADAREAGLPDDGVLLHEGGRGAAAYADAIATYLAFAISKLADWSSTVCSWIHSIQGVAHTFARQAIPMTWDFTEVNPLSGSAGNFANHVDWVALCVSAAPSQQTGEVHAGNAAKLDAPLSLVSTDPPYYDNIGYADLSDFFYVWLRRSLRGIHPAVFRSMLVAKGDELVATPYRFDGDREKAETFFEDGLAKAFNRIAAIEDPLYPATIYYAFRQTEARTEDHLLGEAVTSTGWETMLSALLQSGFAITGTWPMRTERSARSLGIGTNALASSIVLVCRPRPDDAPIATRREFIAELRRILPHDLTTLQRENIAPVDFAQASIGPGMRVFSRYARVLEADGSPMSVRTALGIINAELDRHLEAQEGETDPDTRFCVAWFAQFGMREGPSGDADGLARAKVTSIDGLIRAGVLEARGGKTRLLNREEMDREWDPRTDRTLTVWECAQHLIRALESHGGEEAAAALANRMGADLAGRARDLAYRLYSICERKSWAEEARAYNALVTSWPAIQGKMAETGPGQGMLL